MIPLYGRSQIMNHDEKLTVSRVGRTIYIDGKPKHMDTVSFEIVGNVQPLNARDLLLVPEGDRHKEQYYIYSEKSTRAMEVNDTVIRSGAKYQTQSIEDWGSFLRARIMRIDIGPDRSP